MSFWSRVGVRMSIAAVTAAVPVGLASFSSGLLPTSAGTGAEQAAHLSSSAEHGRHHRRTPEQREEPQTTINGGLQLRTAAERNRKIEITSPKGRHVWTASSLAEHDVPSAAMRAYKNAARTIDAEEPSCHLPWTLLAGIGRVESNHGRFGGSVLGADGVPRPAIVGVALDGKGAVAAVPDTDDGRFDGDTVWDHAVGPMQFIPSTWRTAGRDGDGDGVKSPNDIDDAALAAAAYLCRGGRDLSTVADTRAAIFSYNPSDYYVDLVSAFARGYQSGVFVIPSPDVAPGAGDGVVHLRADTAATKAAKKAAKAKVKAQAKAKAKVTAARAARAARAAAAAAAARKQQEAEARRHHAHGSSSHPSPSPTPSTPTPTPTPSPSAPQAATVTGALVKTLTGWRVGTVDLEAEDFAGVTDNDWDGNGTTDPWPVELDSLATARKAVSLTYTDKPFTVTGFSLA